VWHPAQFGEPLFQRGASITVVERVYPAAFQHVRHSRNLVLSVNRPTGNDRLFFASFRFDPERL
jgi:hypothetical protein